MAKKSEQSKSPNLLHYIALCMMFVGFFMFFKVRILEGFSLWFLGSGIGLLGCEYDSVQNGRRDDDDNQE